VKIGMMKMKIEKFFVAVRGTIMLMSQSLPIDTGTILPIVILLLGFVSRELYVRDWVVFGFFILGFVGRVVPQALLLVALIPTIICIWDNPNQHR